ncbi:peptidoglycan/LPS O-acetylase OafA/YrhL [Ancylobacter aquaticus]|uniref:Peptidoglycan/LPS O-acetylase OafA/YrhL n=1 Tax=Ancylobacter aquaticus TaxID=100 RepID=A0A4R1H4V6_ANCAQ|nr:acyltransferase family protein [Ancylobacter aquaticus]TCK16734.1 peptidoglycan/LPS O-acetylase OafA/YrhL [Ancylobacter aquaticus]
MKSSSYRPDIDGLRALAVIPVILFHAGADWLPGGFVGVDIFFVISGYLITSIIFREMQAGEFSVLRFYERRVRRIMPALLVMLLVTVGAFQVISLPDQARGAAESGLAALLSLSNVYFWLKTGYFAPAAEFMPLLHTWSLAVEEQFYLLFPVFLIVVHRLHLPIKYILALGTIVAFCIGLWLSYNKFSVAYFLLPGRAWELTLGGTIAVAGLPVIHNRHVREVLPAIGVGLILFSLFYIRSDSVFPGWVALMPCGGAALIILAGGHSWVAQRVLGSGTLVFIGLLSYSAYLWHWPLLAAVRIHLGINLSAAAATIVVILTFAVAFLSWRYVEMPFRNRRVTPNRRALGLVGAGSAAFVALALVSIAADGFPSRLNERGREALAGKGDIDPLDSICPEGGFHAECRFGNPDAPVSYAVIGDSHASAIRAAVETSDIMGDTAGTLLWDPGCPLLDGAERLGSEPEWTATCNGFKARVWEFLRDNKNLTTVVLAGRWAGLWTGVSNEVGGALRARLTDGETVSASPEETKRVFARSLTRTLERLSKLGLKTIIIGQVPEQGFDVPRAAALARLFALNDPGGVARQEVEERAGEVDTVLAELSAGRNGVKLLSIWPVFCGPKSCGIERDGKPLYVDDDHLSHWGAITVAAPALAAAMTPPRSLALP